MITEHTPLVEIAEIFLQDYYELEPKLGRYFGKIKEYDRYIIKNLKSDQFHAFKPILYHSKNGNEFVIQYKVNGKAAYKRDGCLYSNQYMIYLLKNGFHAVIKDKDTDGCTFFIPHFFDRYRERELKDMSLTTREVMYKFFPTLSWVSHQNLPTTKYDNNLFCDTGKGIMIGREISKSIIQWNTYLTYEMLKAGQTKYADVLSFYQFIDNSIWNPTEENIFSRKRRINRPLYIEPKDWVKIKDVNDTYLKFTDVPEEENHEVALMKYDLLMKGVDVNELFRKDVYAQFDKIKSKQEQENREFQYKIFNPILRMTNDLLFCYMVKIKEENCLSSVLMYLYKVKQKLYICNSPDYRTISKKYVLSEDVINEYGSSHKELADYTFEEKAINFISRVEMFSSKNDYSSKDIPKWDIGFGYLSGRCIDFCTVLFEHYIK